MRERTRMSENIDIQAKTEMDAEAKEAAEKAAEQDGERGMLAMDLMPHLRQLVNLRF